MNPKMTTTYFKVLEILHDNQLQIGDLIYCPLSQAEIAKKLNCSRMTVNNALKSLKDEGYVICKTHRYSITNKGEDTILKSKDIQ